MVNKLLSIVLIWGLVISPSVFADSGTTRNTYSRNRQLSTTLQVVPDSTTSIATTDTMIFQITVTNVTASAATFTLSDRNTSALDFLKSVSIAANTTYVIAFPEGMFFKNGATWSTGTTSALNASIVGWYK